MARRDLYFKDLDDVRRELDRLSHGKVETSGVWSYYQILTHCAAALENTIKGLRPEMPWWRLHIAGPLAYWVNASRGRLPVGIRGNPQIAPEKREEGDERAALDRLRKAMKAFEDFEGDFSHHRRLGRLSKEQWTLFHAMHLANHLGYARPGT